MTLEHEVKETDAILKLQDTQLELLGAIKKETALLQQIAKQTASGSGS